MSVNETIDLDQVGEWARKLVERAETELRNTAPFVKQAMLRTKESVAGNFENSHDPNGSAWPGLAHPRPRSMGEDQPLRDRGLLLASMTGRGEAHVEDVGPTGFEFGSNLEYAWIHQHGGTIEAAPGHMLAIPATREAVLYRARDFPRKLVLIAHEGKAPVLMEVKATKGGGSTMVLQYYLTPSVTIPARPFAGVGEPLLKEIDELALDHMQRFWTT